MTATLRKSIVVCVAIVLSVTVANADSFFVADSVTDISSAIHVTKANVLLNVAFAQDVFSTNKASYSTSDIEMSEKNLLAGLESFNAEANPLTNTNIKSMPAAPGAVIMCLIGFLLVTLVRDRKFWMSMFAAIILIGQVGIMTVPRIAARLTQNNQHTGPMTKGNFFALKSDNVTGKNKSDTIHYIGLLRRLAGSPANTHVSLCKKQDSFIPSPFVG